MNERPTKLLGEGSMGGQRLSQTGRPSFVFKFARCVAESVSKLFFKRGWGQFRQADTSICGRRLSAHGFDDIQKKPVTRNIKSDTTITYMPVSSPSCCQNFLWSPVRVSWFLRSVGFIDDCCLMSTTGSCAREIKQTYDDLSPAYDNGNVYKQFVK